MSSVHRFLSASAAAWVRILLTIVTQVLLVPIFLSHWSIEEYGCWLIIQSIVGIATIVSSGHQIFVGFEFLKAGDKRPAEMRSLFYSALPYVILIALVELLVITAMIYLGYIRATVDPNRTISPGLLHQTFVSLIIYSSSSLITNSVGGLAGRAVAPYGYFPRMTWWGTLLAIVNAVTSGLAVGLGANLIQTVIWIVAANFVVNIPVHLDMWNMFRRHELYPIWPDWKRGSKNVAHSLLVSLSSVLDISRAQGVRIFLGALIGVAQMTAFSTMRTMSNLSLQGIGTVTNPIMPEIMRFLRERDSDRTNATVGFVWFFAVILLSPILILFQWIMPAVFLVWTRGKIAFDPVLFGLFSVALLIYSIARPSMAVLSGNNLLRVQLYISVANTITAIGGILLFTTTFGVAGAAASLLLAELVGTVLAVWLAWKWLAENGISFPWRLFGVALASIGATAGAIFLMTMLPQGRVVILVVSIAVHGFICIAFIRQLPAVALDKISVFIGRWR